MNSQKSVKGPDPAKVRRSEDLIWSQLQRITLAHNITNIGINLGVTLYLIIKFSKKIYAYYY